MNEIINFQDNGDGNDWEKLNDAQKKAMVDWERNSSSYSFLRGIGSGNVEKAYSIAIDSNDNVYIYFQTLNSGHSPEIYFGDDKINQTCSNRCIVIIKLNNLGLMLWSTMMGSDSGPGFYYYERGKIAIDSHDDVYVSGIFEGALTFGNISLTSSASGTKYSPYLAKLSNNGSWIWANSANGTTKSVYGKDTVIDANDNIYTIGYFSNDVTFGNFTLTENVGHTSMYLSKFSSDGLRLWSIKLSGPDPVCYINGLTLVVDSNENVYTTGRVVGLGNTCTLTNTIFSSGSNSVFMAKFSGLTGQIIWISPIAETEMVVNDITVDSSDNVYITGYFESTITIGNFTLTSNGRSDIFVAKLSSIGTWLWAKGAGGNYWDYGIAITVDSSDNVYITGQFDSAANFGTIELSDMTSGAVPAAFMSKLNRDGKWIWAEMVTSGGINEACGFDVVINSKDEFYFLGDFEQVASIGGKNVVTRGYEDIYLIKIRLNDFGLNNDVQFSSAYINDGSGTGGNTVNGIGIDSSDNVYITGTFGTSVTFGSISLAGGSSDVYVAKLSSTGTWLWASKGVSDGSESVKGIVINHNDEIYITGTFELNFVLTPTGNNVLMELTSLGGKDIFVAKLSSDGIWMWIKQAGGQMNYDDVKGIVVDDAYDFVWITGEYATQLKFFDDGGPNQADVDDTVNLELIANGGLDIFVARISGQGEWGEVKEVYSAYSDYVSGIAMDTSNNIYITGKSNVGMNFGSITHTGGLEDIFVAKLSSTGWSWVANATAGGSIGYSIPEDIKIDSNDDIYITGTYYSQATFGTTSTTSNGANDIYLAKLSSSTGQWIMATSIGGPDYDGIAGGGMSIDYQSNSIYVTGYFHGTITIGNYNLTSYGQADIFLAKLSKTGTWSWAIGGGGSNYEYARGVALDSSGHIYVTGYLQSNRVYFGSISQQVSGSTNSFVVSIGPNFDRDMTADENDEFPFEATQDSDQDMDGFGDNMFGYHGDSCPTIYGTSWQDRWGCPDLDEDGQSDLFDAYMQQPTQWNDTDGDGLGDNWDGINVDRNSSTNGIGEYWPNAYLPDPSPLDYDNDGFEDVNLQSNGAIGPYDDCPLIQGTSTEGSSGCIDSDGDGWADSHDSHLGDSTQWNDTDGDGYGDNQEGNQPDYCPNEYGESLSDVFGCIDTDKDGVSSITDFNDNDSSEWLDSDDDGIGDNSDNCQFVWGNLTSGDERGCPDSDGDGVGDDSDQFENNPTQFLDTDNDGYGDNPNGTFPDACPTESGKSDIGGYGCPDTDRDGYGNNIDKFPADSTQWNDTDNDGFGDSSIGRNSDSCPEENGTSTQGDILGCLDTDGDGWADSIDAFVNDANSWSDIDGDGLSDQGQDDCPNLEGYSEEPWKGCPDLDGDGVMDLADDDTDGDGISDELERRMSESGTIFDPYDDKSTPADLDGDHIPDEMDDDWDGDGFPNSLEIERGSDARDETITPLTMYGDSESGLFYVPGSGFQSEYNEEGIEVSVSALLSMVTSEYLFAILALPFAMIIAGRKKRRFKKYRKKLKSMHKFRQIDKAEKEIDRMIEKGKVRVEHGLLLRNIFERKMDSITRNEEPVPSFNSLRSAAPTDYEEEDYPVRQNSPMRRPSTRPPGR